MPSVFRRTRRTFYYILGLSLLRFLRGVPVRLGRGICRRLALAALSWRVRERELALRNLALAFPDLDFRTRSVILRTSLGLLGENLFDALTIEEAQRRDFVDIEGEQTLAVIKALGAGDRGVLLLTGHLGCWELLGGYLAQRLEHLTVVTGRIHNPAVDRLINTRRRQAGLNVVYRDGDLRPLLSALRKRQVVAVLMDQNTRVDNLDIPFFGTEAPTAVGFARLALRFNMPVLPVAIARYGDGHRIKHQPPIEPSDFSIAGDESRFLLECNRCLERFIRENPQEWVWFHDRWNLGQ